MARSRNIKPGLFKNELLGDADPIYTLLFSGLWCLADKEGRLEDRPKRIKAELFPYRFDVDVCLALDWLKHESFINRYEVEGEKYIQILKWKKHQSPHHKEIDSVIPVCDDKEKPKQNQDVSHAQAKHESSMNHEQSNEIASTPLIPDSLNLIPDSLIVQENTEKSKAKRFSPPSIQDIDNYCKEKKYNIDAERFFNFYESKGWMVGKNKMKNWKAAVSNWAKPKEGDSQHQSGSVNTRKELSHGE